MNVNNVLQRSVSENLQKRIFSSCIMAAIALPPLYLGGGWFVSFVCFLALYAAKEFLTMCGIWKANAYRFVAILSIVLLMLAAYFESTVSVYGWVVSNKLGIVPAQLSVLLQCLHPFYAAPIAIIMLVLSIPIFCSKYKDMVMQESLTLFGILYFGWFLGHLIFLRNMENGFGFVLFLALVVAANDTCAYFVGRWIGKTPLSSLISPHKTVEGLWAGLAGSVLVAVTLQSLVPDLNLICVIAAGLLIGAAAPFGDLVVSVIKRDMRLKDSGTVIPGHGGLLDRLGSLIFAAPNFYYLVLIFKSLYNW